MRNLKVAKQSAVRHTFRLRFLAKLANLWKLLADLCIDRQREQGRQGERKETGREEGRQGETGKEEGGGRGEGNFGKSTCGLYPDFGSGDTRPQCVCQVCARVCVCLNVCMCGC